MDSERDLDGASGDAATAPQSRAAPTIAAEYPTDQDDDNAEDDPSVSSDHGSPESIDVEERSADGRS